MIRKQMVSSIKFLLGLSLIFLTLTAGMMVALQWPMGSEGLVWLVALNKVFAEMLLMGAIALLFFSPAWPLRAVSWAVVIIYSMVVCTQIASLQFSSNYLPAVALENAQHASFLLDTSKIGWLLIVLLALFNTIRFTQQSALVIPQAAIRIAVALILVLSSVLLKNDSYWLSNELVERRFNFYNSGRASIEHKAPGSAMASSLKVYYQGLARERWINDANLEVTAEAAAFAFDYDIKLNEISADYPLLKTVSFSGPPSFIATENWQQKNIIVFFVEGLSSRIIQPYSQLFPAISPNFEDFANQAVVVDDYFNHSFATYRALSGQFCSIYANSVLRAEVNYSCLPHALAMSGYENHFFVSQSLADTYLDDMATRAGFDQVYGSKELVEYIPGTPELDYGLEDFILFDNNFIEAFRRWLEKRESQADKPFFATLYNFQTHTGVRLNSDVKYVDPTGKSESYVLDTFHNFDKAFGTFWEYFKRSRYYENTIVVVTSDHATFGSKDYIELVRDSENFSPIFADKIPLMIYHPHADKQRFSARNASSINFAPSLMHLANVPQESAAFIGNSIFNTENVYPNPLVVSSGVSYFNIDGGHWLRQIQDESVDLPNNAVNAKPFHDLVIYTQSLERQNRLAPPKEP